MASNVAERLNGVKAKPSAARFAPEKLRGESGRNFHALTENQRLVGRYFEHARQIAGLSQSEAAERMGLDPSAVSRLESGLSIPPIIADWMVDHVLSIAFLDAMARRPGDTATSETVIRIAHRERKAAAR